MKILYIGKKSGNSLLAYQSIKKIYKNSEFLNTENFLKFRLFYLLFYHLSPNFFTIYINFFYKKKIIKKYDLIFINNCEFINRSSIRLMKSKCSKIYFYCTDNPFVARDKKRWSLTNKCLDLFDLVIFNQRNRIKHVKKYNIKKYIVIIPPYFENIINKINNKKIYEIVFIGTWFPERGKFFYKLKKLGLKFKIFGPRWNKDKTYYDYLKKDINLNNFSLKEVLKIYSISKISIGLLSKGNDDDITRRCIEIPISRSLLCCEKTSTLKDLLIENKEAIFFSNPEECFQKCQRLLKNHSLIEKISKNGYKKVKLGLRLESSRIFNKILDQNYINKLRSPIIKHF